MFSRSLESNVADDPLLDAGQAEPSFLRSATRPLVITRAIVTRIREAIVDGNSLDRLNE